MEQGVVATLAKLHFLVVLFDALTIGVVAGGIVSMFTGIKKLLVVYSMERPSERELAKANQNVADSYKYYADALDRNSRAYENHTEELKRHRGLKSDKKVVN